MINKRKNLKIHTTELVIFPFHSLESGGQGCDFMSVEYNELLYQELADLEVQKGQRCPPRGLWYYSERGLRTAPSEGEGRLLYSLAVADMIHLARTREVAQSYRNRRVFAYLLESPLRLRVVLDWR